MTLVETKELGKDYGDLTAVAGLDLQIEKGETFGLLGPNGAGKTTVISMICGVLTSSRGTVTINGLDIRKDHHAARRELGLVPQDIAVYKELSALENLQFFGRMAGLRGGEHASAVEWALGVAGLTDRARDLVSKYSGGMQRRLNLAAGILHRPRLLVLDEPTVGVDPQSRAHIFETVRELCATHGMTILYTSHYMEEVEALCTRVGIMDHGQLVALDSLSNLIASHAPGGIEVSIQGEEEGIEEALSAIGPVSRSGDRFLVTAENAAGAVVRAVESSGAHIRSFATREADLEAVFLSLTGRNLRDDA